MATSTTTAKATPANTSAEGHVPTSTESEEERGLLKKILGDSLTIAPSELEALSDMTSKKFGILRLNEESNLKQRKIALKGVTFLEYVLSTSRYSIRSRRPKRRRIDKRSFEGTNQEEDDETEEEEERRDIDPKAYRKLGHLHLLLENYGKALSAYDKYADINRVSAKEDIDYLYGKALVYFHFNAFHFSIQLMTNLLYLNPEFELGVEVHIRLGIMKKMMRFYSASLRHFRLALRGLDPESPKRPEIMFHIGHLHEVEGKSQMARNIYMELLRNVELPGCLKAEVHRQLGWMFYSLESLGEKQARITTAIQHLQKSLELDPKLGQCLYLLGRCYTSLGRAHEAFLAYRTSVDKGESNADTWCSIGVLYQNQQNQQKDALLAFICAIQLEKYHSPAWINLGILYESEKRLQDALTCYTNAAVKAGPGNTALQHRIKYLRNQLSNAPPKPPSPTTQGPNISGNDPRELPSVERAWNDPDREMSTRHHPSTSRSQGRSGDSHLGRKGKDNAEGTGPKPLTAQQQQTLQYLQSERNLLMDQQKQLLQQLQAQNQAYKQYQLKQQQQQQPSLNNPKATHSTIKQEMPSGDEQSTDLLMRLQSKDIGNVSDKELEALISQQDMGSFAESLLKEIEANGDTGIDGHGHNNSNVDLKDSLHPEEGSAIAKDEIKESDDKQLKLEKQVFGKVFSKLFEADTSWIRWRCKRFDNIST